MNIAPPRRCNLLLHCGAEAVSRDALSLVTAPRATHTWQPIEHETLLKRVELTLGANALEIVNEAHSLSHNGDRYFGLLEVRQPGQRRDEWTWVVGLRNSHDKQFPAGIVAGMQVFVCDNLSFSGTVKLARKHTRWIERDLPSLTHKAVTQIVQNFRRQDERIDIYRNTKLNDARAHDLVIRAADVGAITNRHIPDVLRGWREPSHKEFSPRTAWSLFNAATEALKGNLALLPERTTALQGLFDSRFGFGLHGRN